MSSKFYATLTDNAALSLLGERVAATRLRLNRKQSQVADSAGVSISTVKRLENGNSVSLDNLVRILRALDLLPNLDLLVPELPTNPFALKKLQRPQRQRATGEHPAEKEAEKTWKWGDEK